MTSQEEVESTLRWVADEQTVHETAPFGDNLLTVSDAAAAQAHRVRMVGDYKQKVEKMKDDPKGRDMSVHEAYEALQEVASKRMHCLEDVKQIASLEPLFGKLTTEFAQKATQLVEAEAARAAGPGQQPKVGEGVARAAQNCILAVRANWCWISKLVKCADTHLEHVSDYHQFFHTAAEYNEWMPADLDKATAKVATQEKTAATQEEADRLHTDLKEVLTMFLHWHGKVETLFDKSRKIIPVHLRAKKLDYFRPVNTLCDYKTKDITVREGEELTLLDNADSQSWKVRNLSNTTAQVPAVILVIPGPEPAAVKAAGNLRLQLLGIWTYNVKRIGKSLIWFMILCNPNWTDDQIKMLKAMPRAQKDEVRRTLTFIEETLSPYWAEYGGYKELHKRIDTLRAILDQQGPAADHDAEFSNALVSKFNTTEDLLKRYKDLWTHWDTFRIVVEACQAPEFLLIVERWQQLKYLGMDELRNRWHTGFGFSGEDQDEFMEWLERWMTMTTITTEMVEQTTMETGGSIETATSEQVTTAEQEERQTFVITATPSEEEQSSLTAGSNTEDHPDSASGADSASGVLVTTKETLTFSEETGGDDQEQSKGKTKTDVYESEEKTVVDIHQLSEEKDKKDTETSHEQTEITVTESGIDLDGKVEGHDGQAKLDQAEGGSETLIVSESKVEEVVTPTKGSKKRGKKGKAHGAKGTRSKGALKKGAAVAASEPTAPPTETDQGTSGEGSQVVSGTSGQTLITTVTEEVSKSKESQKVDVEDLGALDTPTPADIVEVTGVLTTTTTTTTTTTLRLSGQRGSGEAATAQVSSSSSSSSTSVTTLVAGGSESKESGAKMAAGAGIAGAYAEDMADKSGLAAATGFDTEEELAAAGSEAAAIAGLSAWGADLNAEMLSRVCRAAVPLQMLMVLILGVACLVPMTEEEFSCALANGFDSTISVMMRYRDGPPPT